jgi:hypothetical protein
MSSTISDAIFAIDDFGNHSGGTPWSLDRAPVASRLKELVQSPMVINQGNLNLCGPAATFVLWANRDPLAFAEYCINLFERGQSNIGPLTIKPGSDLLNQSYSAVELRMKVKCHQAEWMAMSALRDSSNLVLDFEGTPEEDVSGITTPGEITDWLIATGCYQSVLNEGNFVLRPGIEHAEKLQPGPGQDVIVLINALMITASGEFDSLFDVIASRFPNHFIVLDSPVEVTNNTVTFTYWTWGVQKELEIDKSVFEENYFGAVIANL